MPVGRVCLPAEGAGRLLRERRFNYYTLEGNPRCEDPLTCEHAAEPLEHVENYRRWLGLRHAAVAQRA